MEATVHYDLFVSYAADDGAWVEGYLLPALGLSRQQVRTHRDFTPGQSLLDQYVRAVEDSHYTVLVLSPAFMADRWGQVTKDLAGYLSAERERGSVIPLLRTPTELDLPLRTLVGLDFSDPSQREGELDKLRALLNQPPPELTRIPCPYPGLRPFGERDCEQFYGREDDGRELLARLAKHPFLAVIGPSGSGKSSLVFAGLVPALRQSGLFGDGAWTILSMRPGSAPLTAPTVVVGTDPVQAGPMFDELTKKPPSGKVLLVVDQFEELFAVTARDAPATGEFQEALAALVQQPGRHVMITARADFYPDLMASPLWPHIQQHRYEVLPLGDDGLRRAIARPAERAGVHIESALVERLVNDAAGEPGALPLMQEALVYLWEELKGRFIGVEQYEELARQAGEGAGHRSGLQAAMARHADAVFANLTEAQQVIARRILLRLIQFGEGRADTRRQQPETELRSVTDDPYLFESTLDLLAQNRLVTLGSVEGGVSRGR